VLASLLASAGCYKPHVLSGGLRCAPNLACPDNFKCDTGHDPPVCVSSLDGGAAGATGGTPETGGTGGSGTGGTAGVGGGQGGQAGKPATGGTGGVACLAPIANCTTTHVAGGACDPVCNVGCASCDKKCSVNSTGALTCNQLSPPGKTVGVLGSCIPSMIGTDPATQSDNCQPGTACINRNACGARCYKFCRSDSDCPSAASCSVDAGGGNTFCDVPVVACDPVNGAATKPGSSGCSGNTQSCYISGDTGTTVCDCYQGSGVGLGQPCTRSRDCYGGLACTDPFGNVGKKCYKVCRLSSADGGADATHPDAGEMGCTASSCTPMLLGNGMQTPVYGVCPSQ
jgi:hypothetical protein